jgi:hypothetical protein
MKAWFALLVRRRVLVLVVALAAAAGGIANLEAYPSTRCRTSRPSR